MIIKKNGHSLELNAGVLKIIDHNNDGVLMIHQALSREYVQRLNSPEGESEENPLVELANMLNQALDENKLAFNIKGDQNFITVWDDDTVILEGSISLRNVQLTNPYLVNVNLQNVDLRDCMDLTIKHSNISDLQSEVVDHIHINFCSVDDDNRIDLTERKNQWFLNRSKLTELH